LRGDASSGGAALAGVVDDAATGGAGGSGQAGEGAGGDLSQLIGDGLGVGGGGQDGDEGGASEVHDCDFWVLGTKRLSCLNAGATVGGGVLYSGYF